MSFTAKDVQILREKTGCGMMDCKKALTETEGDMDKAVDLLREKGLAAATKKAARIAAEGICDCYVEGNTGVVIEVNSETDFVAKNEDFMKFVRTCAMTALKQNPDSVEALLTLTPDGESMTVDAILKEKILTIGENLNIRRFTRIEGKVATYVHGGGRIGVVADFESDLNMNEAFADMGKSVCMQIAAMNPQYMNKDEVPAGDIEKEKEVLFAQIKNDPKNDGKPDNIVEKMVLGRIGKFYDNNCLEQQEFIKDSTIKVGQYIENTAKELGGSIKLKSFIRYEKGEGLQKREDDFATEVAKMTN